MSTDSLPPEFDFLYYRSCYGDLSDRDEALLKEHYETFGRREGRTASPASRREEFLKLVPTDRPVLEIGPFYKPSIRGPNVAYFDIIDREALQQRAAAIGYDTDDVPQIDYVDPNRDLRAITRTFAAVVSSHFIEHQPDLVSHLLQVSRILEPGGRYFLLVPNKLYCCDHFIAESTIANVLDAHRAGHRVHRLESVIGHRALTTHNDPGRHWNGDHTDPSYWASIPARTRAALAEYDAAKRGYIDVHAWQFTPPSFRNIMHCLLELGLTSLNAERIYDTPLGCNEFTAALRKS